MKIAVITGGSSGIGLACCKKLSANGYKVYEISRRASESNNGIVHVYGDVTDEESVKNAFAEIFEKEKHIDILVNNAGFGISGAIEYTSLQDAKAQFDVNFFGTFLCSKTVIDYMRKNGGGKIINISSMAAPLAIPFQAFYSASKAAINSFTLSLANEVRPFGIKVCAVMPGDVKSGFTAARKKNIEDGIYKDVLKKSVSTMEHDEQNGMSPDKIADAVYKCACASHPKPLSTKGIQYKTFACIAKILPTSTVNFLVGKIYASK